MAAVQAFAADPARSQEGRAAAVPAGQAEAARVTLPLDTAVTDRSGQLTDRFGFEGHRSGCMTYLRDADLETANDHIRDFIDEVRRREAPQPPS